MNMDLVFTLSLGDHKFPVTGVVQVSAVLVQVPSLDKLGRIVSGRASCIKPVPD